MAYENAVLCGSYELRDGDNTRNYAQNAAGKQVVKFVMNWYDSYKVMEPVITFEDGQTVSGRLGASENLWRFIDGFLEA